MGSIEIGTRDVFENTSQIQGLQLGLAEMQLTSSIGLDHFKWIHEVNHLHWHFQL